MIAARLVFRTALDWTLLVLVAAAGLVALASGVEAVARGTGDLVAAALRPIPEVLVFLSPLVALLGAALAAAWMQSRGERTALESLGLGADRTGIPVAVLGALVGLVQLVAADRVVPLLRDVEPAWVWLPDGTAVEPSTGLAVTASAGSLQPSAARPSAEAIARAAEILDPSRASGAALATATARLPRIEWHGRRARILACAALAFLGWLPLGATTERQVLAALSGGLAFLATDAVVRSLAGWGHVPVIAGSWSAPVAITAVTAVLARRA